jgi:hypothetical protein
MTEEAELTTELADEAPEAETLEAEETAEETEEAREDCCEATELEAEEIPLAAAEPRQKRVVLSAPLSCGEKR